MLRCQDCAPFIWGSHALDAPLTDYSLLAMQQLSDKGTLDTEEAIAEQQQEEDERNGPVIAPTPVQLKCTLEILNEGEPCSSPSHALSLYVGPLQSLAKVTVDAAMESPCRHPTSSDHL